VSQSSTVHIASAEELERNTRKNNGPLYPDSFSKNGRVKLLSDGEKITLLEGKWDSADLFKYSFPYRFDINTTFELCYVAVMQYNH
jgi:hypothetical protein